MPDEKKKEKRPFKTYLFWFVLVTLALSVVYSAIMMSLAPAELEDGAPYQKLKSDYLLMLVQCLLGIIVIFLPSVIERRFKVDIPNFMEGVYFIFLFAAIYLGEIRDFYYVVPHWDTILHAISGVMLASLGFYIVQLLNSSINIRLELSPFFICLFAFCFAVTLGTMWEIYEFTFDGILGLNMQKFMLEDGTQLAGRAALSDTMKDLIVDAIGALVVCVLGFFTIKKENTKSSDGGKTNIDADD